MSEEDQPSGPSRAAPAAELDAAPDWLALDRRHVWHPYTAMETYIAQHSDADFSHGTCPDCVSREHGLHQEETRAS